MRWTPAPTPPRRLSRTVSRLPTPIRLLTSAPATVPALVGVLVLLALPTVGEDLAGNAVFTYGAGYRALTWYPVALFLLALLVATAFVLPARLSEVPRPVLIAAGLLAAFPKGSAAPFLMALWPAVTLAARRELPWWLRGVFAGGAVMLADVALLSQSRGGVFTFPVVLILFFVLVPGRARLFALAVPVAAAIAVTAPRVLHGAT